MRKKIIFVIILFILLFFIISYISIINFQKIPSRGFDYIYEDTLRFVKLIEKDDKEKLVRHLVFSGVFDNIYLVENDEFIGNVDRYIKENTDNILKKSKIIKKNRLYYTEKIGDKKFIFSKKIDSSYLYKSYISNLLIYFLLIILNTILFIYITYYFVLNPLNKFSKYTEEIAKGNYDININIEGSKEINQLKNSFDKMLGKINKDIKLLKFVINNMNLGFILFDKKGTIILSNNKARNEFSGELKNKNIYELIPFLDRQNIDGNKLYTSKKVNKFEGTPIYIDIVYSNFNWFNENDKVIIFKKIQNIKFEKNKKLQSMFNKLSYMLAHEIKNPLNVISMILQTMRMKYNEKEMLDQINDEIKNIESILTNLTIFLDINNEVVEVTKLVNSMIDKWTNLYKKKKIQLNCKVEENLNILFDKNKLRIIINNILKNSYENLEKNDIINLNVFKKSKNVIFEINDLGKGISKDDLLKITEDKYSKKEDKIIGWGLYIVKHLIKLYGGDLSIESKKGSHTKVRMVFKSYENNGS